VDAYHALRIGLRHWGRSAVNARAPKTTRRLQRSNFKRCLHKLYVTFGPKPN